MALVILAVGAWKGYRHTPEAAYPWGGASALLLISEFFIPPLALWIFRAWMGLAEVLGVVNTYILLTLVYFFIMTPVGFFLRLSARKSRFSAASCRERKSSWQPLTASLEPESYYRPY